MEIESIEAEKMFSHLLQLIEQGHSVVIKHQGKSVAKLSCPDDSPEHHGALSPDQILARFRAIRNHAGPGTETIRSMIVEGR